MILTGVALGSLFSAGTTALMYFAESMQIAAIVFWQFGDAGKAGWSELAIMTVISLPAVIYFMRNSWNYNSMKAGDETAKSLGVNVERVRIVGMVVASLLTAVIVSFIGIVGFVGLVIPHIVRRFIGGNEMYLIPYSCVTGAAITGRRHRSPDHYLSSGSSRGNFNLLFGCAVVYLSYHQGRNTGED